MNYFGIRNSQMEMNVAQSLIPLWLLAKNVNIQSINSRIYKNKIYSRNVTQTDEFSKLKDIKKK